MKDVVEEVAGQADAIQLVMDLEKAGAITDTSLTLTDPNMPFDRYEALGRLFGRVRNSSAWWLGDWINFGEGAYGERFAQAMTASGLDEDTLQTYGYVCRSIAPSRRRTELRFSTHRVVAPLPPAKQKYWLDKAVKNGWSRETLRQAIAEAEAEANPPLPGSEPDTPSSWRRMAEEIIQRVVGEATEHIDGQHMLVRKESIARLRALIEAEA